MKHGARIGDVYGMATIVGEAVIPYRCQPSGRLRYCVRVECWSCKRTRDALWHNVRYGRAGLCRSCAYKVRKIRGKIFRPRPFEFFIFRDNVFYCPCSDCHHTRARRIKKYNL
jgi:hypothetical protein